MSAPRRRSKDGRVATVQDDSAMSTRTEPSPNQLRPLDRRCDDFEQAWFARQRPRIEDYLFEVAADLVPRLREELIRTELELRLRAGEQLEPVEYRDRFPESAAALDGWLTDARQAAATLRVHESPAPSTVSHLEAATHPVGVGAPPPRLLGEYELLEPLGKGGMGEVWKARQARLDKIVAVKVLRTDRSRSREAVQRFAREIRAVGALDHPNLVEASYAGEQEGILYLVMKFVEGVDLARLVKEKGPRPVREVCELARQIAQGLQYLHERGLVHRDLKPSNVMCTPDGVVKILDLGLARWQLAEQGAAELTTSGLVLGTPDYLAPEQLQDAATVDTRADLYGLGGTIFYLLTGKPVFADQGSVSAKVKAHAEQGAPDVRSLRPDVPVALATLLASLLAKRPEDRPQTPARVVEALTAIMAPPPAARWAHRARAAAIVLVLLAVGAALLLRDSQPASAPQPVPSAEAALGLQVRQINVMHFATVSKDNMRFAQPRGLFGKDTFAARVHDTVTIEARLSRPAYAFLIAYRPDGAAELCFPENEDERPPLTDRPRYPFVSRSVQYGMNEGAGLQVFAIVCSTQPLPAYRAWQQAAAPVGWSKQPGTPGVVWFDDGGFVEAFTDKGRERSERGKGQLVAGRTPLVQLCDQLRKRPGVEAVGGIALAVLPAE